MRVSVWRCKWWHASACCGLVTRLGGSVVGCPHCRRPLPCVDTPSPSLMGCPCFAWGWGVCCSPPLCCGLPHCLRAPPGLDPIVYDGIHLSHRERTRYPNYIERRNHEPGSHHHRHGSVGAGIAGLADRTAAHLAAGR
nr:MAG TPA: hypothetical protein [Caudoviricetes sp.]